MKRIFRINRRLLTVAATSTALLAAGGIAYASIPAPGGVVDGCYKNSTGMLITIDSAASCPTGYTALNWNQTGPQGPTGATGATGPQGPAGPSPTASEVTVDVAYGPTDGPNVTQVVDCPSGKQAVNGGVTQSTASASWQTNAPLAQAMGNSTYPGGVSAQATQEDDATANTTNAVDLSIPRPVNSGGSWKVAARLSDAFINNGPYAGTYGITVTYFAECI